MTAPRSGALMVCGTSSDAGKSTVVAGLCRVLARRGVSVAPFKAQNMALNSVVTPDGGEIGRAQGMQAMAAGIEPERAMNPILLKPTGEQGSQVVVNGEPWAVLDAAAYQEAKPDLSGVVLDALADLRGRYDVVLCEGAGSPAEINLLQHDLVNLGLAVRAGVPAVVVGDIDRGGVFAHLFGTVELLPPELRPSVRGFVVNKFRGDRALLAGAAEELEARCGVPTFGVLPFLPHVGLDAEDSLALGRTDGPPPASPAGVTLDVAVVRLPHISNFTDLDALTLEPGAAVRFVAHTSALGDPDLVVLPGSKATVADLGWLRSSGLAAALERLRRSARPPVVLGVCGGFQMLGRRIHDVDRVESPGGSAEGLGWLPVETHFHAAKATRRRRGRGPRGVRAEGYEIHHGEPRADAGAAPWFELEPAPGAAGGGEGVADATNGVYGTSLHGVLECDELRSWLLGAVGARRGVPWVPSGVSFAAARQAQLDRIADACEEHLDLDRLWSVVEEAAPVAVVP